MRKKKIILLFITLLWTGIMISFSMQPADVSSDMSAGFGTWLLETFLPGIYKQLELMPQQQLELWHTILRKCAHFSEYLVLGILWTWTLWEKKMLISWGLCILTAAVDETVQLFVPGRSGQVTDVCLDSEGALTGILLCLMISKMSRIYLERRRNG